jgi:GAF domain-containing protein
MEQNRMDDQRLSNPVETPGIEVLTNVRTRMRNAVDRGLTAESIIQSLRLNIINFLLIASSVVVVIAYLLVLPDAIDGQKWLRLILLTTIVAGLLIVTIFRRISIGIRTRALLVLLFAISVITLMQNGLYGNGSILLLSIPVLGVILLGALGTRVGLPLTIGAMTIVGLMMVTGAIPAPSLPPNYGNSSPVSWTVAVGIFALTAIIMTTTLWYFVRGMEISLQKQGYLAEELDRERLMLETRVAERTENLERRLLQIRTAADISRTISNQMDVDRLLPDVCELIKERFELYYVGIFLIIEEIEGDADYSPAKAQAGGIYAVLSAGTGEAGRNMLAASHKLLVGGDSMIGWATGFRQARIALDVGMEAVRFSNPHLPNTRSEMALPIMVQDQVLGAISIQSDKAEAFDDDDITVLQGIADSLGSAIQNARLFTEVQNSLDEIQTLHRHYLQQAWSDVIQSQGELAYTYQPTYLGETADAANTIEVPLKLRDQVIGRLTLEADDGGATSDTWSPEKLALIETIADQAALALENARLLEETQHRAEYESVRASIANKVWQSTNVDTILRTALQELGASLGAVEGIIQLEADK